MQQLNAYRFYELGARLHGLFSNSNPRINDMFAPLTEAQTLLDNLIKGEDFTLDVAKPDANRLLGKISAVFNRYFIDPTTKQLRDSVGEDRIDNQEIAIINSLIERFEHSLAADINRAAIYVATKRGIYATLDLAEQAENIFSAPLRKLIPQSAQNEINQSGRALVFGLGTASAIHTLRAVDLMLRTYAEAFIGTALKSERNYTTYLKKLASMVEGAEERPNGPDNRVVHMLTQIKEHYRAPLLTPENSVGIEEATQLLGIAGSLVSMMAEHLATRQAASSRQTEKTLEKLAQDDEDSEFDIRLSHAV